MEQRKQQEINHYWAIRSEAKKYYSKIGEVPCPAFNDEPVIFNAMGFNHLIRKGGALRSEKDQVRRFRLLGQVISILTTPNTQPDYREEETAEFWTFKRKYRNKIVKTIVRQLSGGKKHFFSIMDNS